MIIVAMITVVVMVLVVLVVLGERVGGVWSVRVETHAAQVAASAASCCWY